MIVGLGKIMPLRIAVNLLTQKKRVKRRIKNKQFLAAMDNNSLTIVLALAKINILKNESNILRESLRLSPDKHTFIYQINF
ncbi:hypothetical protein [Nostoc sp. UHCC 0252]|uniref:hypothetical protein n=1 Tax=Nostoc sp. UHCC 0252 TaxID=3110241 RepID=UPI003A4C8379